MTKTSNFIKVLNNPLTRNILCRIKSRQYSNLYQEKVRVFYDGCYIHQYNNFFYANWKPYYKDINKELEDFETNWFYDYNPNIGDIVVDIGAGVGLDTILFSKKVGTSGRVIAIEAHPQTFFSLKKTCEYNKADNVILLNLAICDSNKSVFIEDRDGHEMNKLVENKGIKISGKKLDTLIEEQSIEKIDFLKMNIEGAEKFALKGMINTLKITRNVCISCHDFLADKYNDEFYRSKDIVKDFLIKNNFEIIEREHENPWTSDMIYGKNKDKN